MKKRKFLFPGALFLASLLIVISANTTIAKSYVYQGGTKKSVHQEGAKTYVVDDHAANSKYRRTKSRKEALQLSKDWRKKALAAIKRGDFGEAVKAATMAIGYAPAETENYKIRAQAFTGLGDITKASKDLAKIIKINPGASDAYNELGELSEKFGRFTEAKKYYQKSCGMDYSVACDNLNRITVGIIGNPDEELKHASTPEDYERFIETYKPDELAFVAVQRLARPYIKVRDWQGAVAVFQKYRQNFPDMQKRFSMIIGTLIAPEEDLDFRNVGKEVNTEKGEYHPVISADGTTLFFGRDCGAASGGEDIFIADLQDEVWGNVKSFGPPVNTKTHEVPLAISADGNTMALFGNYPESFGRGDIFYTDKTTRCWSNIKHYPAPINSEYFESNAMYTADGKSILFVSERPGGVGEFHAKDVFYHGGYGGNTDIYVYTQNENGEYEVINLGDTINTPYSEYSPYLHPDGKTLYFSSDGHYGLGGLDLFVSKRLSDTSWTEWSQPINLGKQINSPNNDWGYQITTDGKWAYYSASDRLEGFGANDIYMAQLPRAARPHAVTTVSGTVTDPNGSIVENVQIRWNDIVLQKEVGEAKSDPQTGKYFIALPAGRLYGYYAEKEGYMGRSEEVDLRDKSTYAEYTVDIMMYPIDKIREEMLTIRMNNVFFAFNKWSLSPQSSMELDRWVSFLKDHPDIKAQIHGHTDSTGPAVYNQSLSDKRSASVVRYLVSHGIDRKRLISKGFGESKPVSTNSTREGRKLNRRVEIHFNGNSKDVPKHLRGGESALQPSTVPKISNATETTHAASSQKLSPDSQQESALSEEKIQEIRDDVFRDTIVGTWVDENPNSKSQSIFNADGTALLKTEANDQDKRIKSVAECTWEIKDGKLISTVVKSSGDLPLKVGTESIDEIDLLDETTLVLIASDGTSTIKQRIE